MDFCPSSYNLSTPRHRTMEHLNEYLPHFMTVFSRGLWCHLLHEKSDDVQPTNSSCTSEIYGRHRSDGLCRTSSITRNLSHFCFYNVKKVLMLEDTFRFVHVNDMRCPVCHLAVLVFIIFFKHCTIGQ